MDGIVARLKVLLGIDSAEFSEGAEDADKSWTTLQGRIAKGAKLIAGAVAAVGLASLVEDVRRATNESVKLAKEMTSAAQGIGISTDALQQYDYIAQKTGASQDVMRDGLGELTRKLGEAAEGSKSAIALFDRLGVSIFDTNGKVRDGASAFPLVADAIMKVGSEAQRQAIQTQLFGEEAGPKLSGALALGSAGIADMTKEFGALGLAISGETLQSLGDMGKELEQINQQLSKEQAESIVANKDSILAYEGAIGRLKIQLMSMIGDLGKLDPWLDQWDANMVRVRDGVNEMVMDIITALPRIFVNARSAASDTAHALFQMASDGVAAAARLVSGVRDWLGVKIGAVFDGLKRRIDEAGQWFFGLYDKVVGHSYIPDMVDEIGQHMRRLDAELLAPVRGATQSAREMFRALQQDVSSILGRLFPEQAEKNQYDRELKTLNDYFDALIKHGGDALAIEKQREAAVTALKRAYLGLARDRAGAIGDDPADIVMLGGGKSLDEMIDEAGKRLPEALGKIGDQADELRVRFVDSFAKMFDGALSQVDRFVNGIKSGNWLDIIGGLLNSIDAIAGLFTGGKGFKIGSATIGGGTGSASLPPLIPQLANGGSMILGGASGLDRNLLSLNGSPIAKVTRGETMTITPSNDRGGSGGVVVVRVEEGALFRPVVESTAGRVVAAAAPSIASAGAVGGETRIRRSASRRLT